MQSSDVIDYARRLYEAHGDTAEAEAAKKAHDCLDNNDREGADDWQRIRATIRTLRGANAS